MDDLIARLGHAKGTAIQGLKVLRNRGVIRMAYGSGRRRIALLQSRANGSGKQFNRARFTVF